MIIGWRFLGWALNERRAKADKRYCSGSSIMLSWAWEVHGGLGVSILG